MQIKKNLLIIENSSVGEDLVNNDSIATGNRKIPNKPVIIKSGVKYNLFTGVYISKLSV